MVREEEIINDVVYNLRRLTNLEDIIFKAAEQSKSYGYNLTINGVTFACDVRPQVNKANYNLIVQHMRSLKEQTDKLDKVLTSDDKDSKPFLTRIF